LPVAVRRASLVCMAAIFAGRSALGFAGKTALISPGSDSERFMHLDRWIYAPVCFGLSVGTLLSMGQTTPQI
jgi:hypothetical protein